MPFNHENHGRKKKKKKSLGIPVDKGLIENLIVMWRRDSSGILKHPALAVKSRSLSEPVLDTVFQV